MDSKIVFDRGKLVKKQALTTKNENKVSPVRRNQAETQSPAVAAASSWVKGSKTSDRPGCYRDAV